MATVEANIQNSNSFHPKSLVTFDLSQSETVSESCSLHLLYKLSPSLFIDPYELAQHQESYTSTQWGDIELEKPVHAVQDSDTNLLVTVNQRLRNEGTTSMRFEVEVPLHARYLAPSSQDVPGEELGNYRHVPLERPQAFFACPKGPDQESAPPPIHISATQLAAANLSSSIIQFIHIPYSSNYPVDFVRVPVGRQEHLFGVQVTTSVIILLIFLWVTSATIHAARRLISGSTSGHLKTA
ncbi:hypothetical protein AN958_01849 [Leucoagaricus sp. SymC.cos]|nr:hypothetical protein AN958_01849 [Leucoagaricus sp. SymC.cos]